MTTDSVSSNTVASHPRRISAMAVARPAILPPTMAAHGRDAAVIVRHCVIANGTADRNYHRVGERHWRQPPIALRIGVHSPNAQTRDRVVGALGTTLRPDLPELAFTELATGPAVLAKLDQDQLDCRHPRRRGLAGRRHGLAKQIRDEYVPCPLLVVAERPQPTDGWLIGCVPTQRPASPSTRSNSGRS